MSDTSKLTLLGNQKTKYELNEPNPSLLETFNNQHEENYYLAPFDAFEFSSLCPKTGQPDFAKFYITYVPDKECVESKSLKLYLFSFRNSGEFMEDITNRIAKDLYKLLNPYYIQVYADFNSRGGIYLRPFVELWKEDIDPSIQEYINGMLERYERIKIR